MNPLKWRKMTWVINIVNVIFLIWIIGGIASRPSQVVPNDNLCINASDAGTSIGVGLIIFLWFLVFVVLSIIWFMTRPKHRLCPACGVDVKKGLTACPQCSHDFAAAARSSETSTVSSRHDPHPIQPHLQPRARCSCARRRRPRSLSLRRQQGGRPRGYGHDHRNPHCHGDRSGSPFGGYPPSPTTPSPNSSTSGRTERRFGGTGIDGEIAFSVTGWREASQVSQEYDSPVAANSGARFVEVTVTIENKGKVVWIVCGQSGSVLVDSEDRNFEPDDAQLYYPGNDSCGDDLQPGFKRTETLSSRSQRPPRMRSLCGMMIRRMTIQATATSLFLSVAWSTPFWRRVERG